MFLYELRRIHGIVDVIYLIDACSLKWDYELDLGEVELGGYMFEINL